MYQIYADDTLIFDSTIEDLKINKGEITLELNKSGSFVFSIYPEHFYYDSFVKMKTVITVYKSGDIVFRGRVLDDSCDYWNNKVLTCEGELSFLQDSIIRPYDIAGTPIGIFQNFISEHNSQVDEFKRFNIGKITVSSDSIERENTAYESAYANITSQLVDGETGGYLSITHENGQQKPTIHYLSDFEHVASQTIEFGKNLKNYIKTSKANEIGTALIPIGADQLTIESVNNGVDYIYSPEAVALYGWIFKTVEWSEIKTASELKATAEQYLETLASQTVTIDLNAIDLHLLDASIESFKVGDYIRVISTPHNFDATLLCNKQTLNLLKPENDTVTLGHTVLMFSRYDDATIKKSVNQLNNKLVSISSTAIEAKTEAQTALIEIEELKEQGFDVDLTEVWNAINQHTIDIEVNTTNISINADAIADLLARVGALENGGQSDLPSGYTPLLYIESSGTQYIDTGFKPNQDTRIVFDGYNDATNSGWTFGGCTSLTSNQFMFSCSSANSFRYGSTGVSLANVPIGHFVADLNKNTYKLNNETGSLSSQTFSCPYTAYLFKVNSAGTASTGSFIGKLYSCQIYDNGTLVRDFVPCLNVSGKSGLYDKVNGVFYGNAGTGEFMYSVSRKLPDGYTQLEYIESSGTQYIDTGIIGKAGVTMELDFSSMGTDLSNYLPCGCADSSYTKRFYPVATQNTAGNWSYGFGNWYNSNASANAKTRYKTVTVLKNGQQSLTVNGETVLSGSLSSASTPNINIYLFGINYAGTINTTGSTRLYGCNMYENDVLVRDYVPCKNPSNEIGLYDITNGIFYPNAGTGSFVGGV